MLLYLYVIFIVQVFLHKENTKQRSLVWEMPVGILISVHSVAFYLLSNQTILFLTVSYALKTIKF